MTNEDIAYISDGFIEMYQKLSSHAYRYIPYDAERTVRNKTGTIDFVHKEDLAVETYGFTDEKVTEDIVDPDTARKGDSRIVVGIQFVRKALRDAGITPMLRDAVDIPRETGGYMRYLVTGFDRSVDLPDVFIKVILTEKSVAFRGS